MVFGEQAAPYGHQAGGGIKPYRRVVEGDGDSKHVPRISVGDLDPVQHPVGVIVDQGLRGYQHHHAFPHPTDLVAPDFTP